MDFSLEYDKEQSEFAKEFNEWLDKNIPAGLESPRDPLKMSRDQYKKRREFGRRLGEKGWLYPGYPKQYGGGGLDMRHTFVIAEELSKRSLGLPPFYDSGRLAIPAVLASGTDEQRKRFLPPMLKGEVVTWQLFTEPEAGTDESNQQTNAIRAVREKDNFVINGGKIFVGGLYPPPDQVLLLTRSDMKAPRHENLAMFLAPGTLSGISITPLDLFPVGVFAHVHDRIPDSSPGVKHQVFLDDVKVHESYLIGGERDGWRVANATLAVEHGGGAGSGGGGRAGQEILHDYLLDKFIEHCRTNPRVRQRLAANPQLLDSMIEVYIGAQFLRLISIRNTWLAGSGKRIPYAGDQLALCEKLYGARVVADMAKVLGPGVFTGDSEWGFDGDLFEVPQRCGVCCAPAGTPEALKIGIARALHVGR